MRKENGENILRFLKVWIYYKKIIKLFLIQFWIAFHWSVTMLKILTLFALAKKNPKKKPPQTHPSGQTLPNLPSRSPIQSPPPQQKSPHPDPINSFSFLSLVLKILSSSLLHKSTKHLLLKKYVFQQNFLSNALERYNKHDQMQKRHLPQWNFCSNPFLDQHQWIQSSPRTGTHFIVEKVKQTKKKES